MNKEKEHFGVEEALDILKTIDEKVYFHDSYHRIEGNTNSKDVSSQVKLLEKLFGCGCYKSVGESRYPGKYDLFSASAVWWYDFKPTKITNCPIRLKESRSLTDDELWNGIH